jgi:hypothetical protein
MMIFSFYRFHLVLAHNLLILRGRAGARNLTDEERQTGMNIIIYSDSGDGTAGSLESRIEAELPGVHVDAIEEFDELSRKLCCPMNRVAVAIVFPRSTWGIESLKAIEPCFDGTRLILVLPDRTKELIASALRLSPTYIGFQDSPPEEITSILRKIRSLKHGTRLCGGESSGALWQRTRQVLNETTDNPTHMSRRSIS